MREGGREAKKDGTRKGSEGKGSDRRDDERKRGSGGAKQGETEGRREHESEPARQPATSGRACDGSLFGPLPGAFKEARQTFKKVRFVSAAPATDETPSPLGPPITQIGQICSPPFALK